MIALHMSLLDGIPYLWCESSEPASIRELRSAVKAIGLEAKIFKSNTREYAAWLPSRGGEALASSPLIGTSPDRRKKLHLKPFNKTVRSLLLDEFLELTAIAAKGNIPGSGVIFGNSITWSRQLLEVVFNLISSEAFLPAMINREDYWEARWLPLPDEKLELHIEKTVADMPAVCRCLSESAEKAPEVSARVAVNQLLAFCIDAFLRNPDSSTGRQTIYTNIHDAWLQSLKSENARVEWNNKLELQEFARQLTQWRRPVDLIVKSPFKFCFRLAEPDQGSDWWQVDYLLQPKADPSLKLKVSSLWIQDSKAFKQVERFGKNPVEFMLTALGQASRICPEISNSLKHKNPGGFKLEAVGALRFLRGYAEALRSAGFIVILPSWWVERGPLQRLGLKVKAVGSPMQGGGNGLTLNSLINFDYTAALNGEEWSLEELKSLARLKAPLVKMRGQWMQIDKEQIKSAIKFLEKQQNQKMTGRELVATALGAEKIAGGFPVESVQVGGWLEELLEKLSGNIKITQLRQPKGFSGKMRPYQKRGYSWLNFMRQWGLGACLADDMGLGKTIQALALIQRQRESGEQGPVLLVCPTSVINNWRREAERFTPGLKTMIHHGGDRHKKQDFVKAAEKHAIVILSYGLLHRDVDFLKGVQWAGIILDEAQNIKNSATKQSKAARSLYAGYRLALTGTPVENHVGDLWALMDFLNPGLLGTQTFFKKKYYRPIQIFRNETTAASLKKLSAPFILRRLKTDKSIISDLPEKMEMKTFCTLTKEQASLYKAVLDDMQDEVEQSEGINRRGLVLSMLTKLKQVCNHPAQFAGDNSSIDGRSGKLNMLLGMLDEIREMNERTLIFTQYAKMGHMMQEYFQGQFGEEVLFLHGSLTKKKRDVLVDRFQNDKNGPRIFILSLKAGGTGLTLYRANHVIHYDRWWNPAVENQATDRAFRIGQTKNVQVHKFIVAGTLEERIDKIIESKTGIANQVVGIGEQWLSELSNNDLRELIKLGAEAVGE